MDNQVQIPPDIRNYLESILQEAGMLTLDDQTKEGMIQELFFQLDNFLASLIVKNLKPEDLEAFIKMNEEKSSKEEIEKFVQEKLPNAQEIFANAFSEFKRLYIENVQSSRDKQPDTE
jgi:hypothetical protein